MEKTARIEVRRRPLARAATPRDLIASLAEHARDVGACSRCDVRLQPGADPAWLGFDEIEMFGDCKHHHRGFGKVSRLSATLLYLEHSTSLEGDCGGSVVGE